MRHAIQVEKAVSNNAHWCDTISRAHAIPGVFHTDIWLNHSAMPRFYPNVVTLSAQSGIAAQHAEVQGLIHEESLAGFAVKDSYATLDLTELAFDLFFEATWIWHTGSGPRFEQESATLRWTEIREAEDLRLWEVAWSDTPADEQSPPLARVFLPTLLNDDTIRFIAAYQGERIVAGAIANRTDDVVGLSNLFVSNLDQVLGWAGCLSMIHTLFPGMPVVGYERGNDLVIAQSLGFDAIGPLRVWGYTRPSSS